jgi:hypothetical protein
MDDAESRSAPAQPGSGLNGNLTISAVLGGFKSLSKGVKSTLLKPAGTGRGFSEKARQS